MMNPNMIPIADAAREFNLSEPQLRGWIQRGILKNSVKQGNRVYVDRDEVRAEAERYHTPRPMNPPKE